MYPVGVSPTSSVLFTGHLSPQRAFTSSAVGDPWRAKPPAGLGWLVVCAGVVGFLLSLALVGPLEPRVPLTGGKIVERSPQSPRIETFSPNSYDPRTPHAVGPLP